CWPRATDSNVPSGSWCSIEGTLELEQLGTAPASVGVVPFTASVQNWYLYEVWGSHCRSTLARTRKQDHEVHHHTRHLKGDDAATLISPEARPWSCVRARGGSGSHIGIRMAHFAVGHLLFDRSMITGSRGLSFWVELQNGSETERQFLV
ncbi:MAG TPA: hypothetical protein PK149_08035, partial [Flavobacteriales bacterium]|nr:hypothetical protein [Flavobacteriales bacterium]